MGCLSGVRVPSLRTMNSLQPRPGQLSRLRGARAAGPILAHTQRSPTNPRNADAGLTGDHPTTLRPDDCSVGTAELGPRAVVRMLRERVLGRLALVEVDAEAGELVRPHRAVADLGGPREHLPHHVAEERGLLDAEVGARE